MIIVIRPGMQGDDAAVQRLVKLAEGYPEKGWFGPGTAERRALERLEYLMGYCAYLVDDERTDERDYMCNRLRETLDWLVARAPK